MSTAAADRSRADTGREGHQPGRRPEGFRRPGGINRPSRGNRPGRGNRHGVPRRIVPALLGVLAVVAGLLGVDAGSRQNQAQAWEDNKPANVIWVMVDDFSWDLVPYMSEVRAMQRNGVTFDNYYVADSLCCPSRATMMTGLYPHNTGVRTNTGPNGGFTAWKAHDNGKRTFAAAADKRGYTTGFIGKYLNGMEFQAGERAPHQPGWDFWRPYNGRAYQEVNGYAVGNGSKPAAHSKMYATDRMKRHAGNFIDDHAGKSKKFLLEVATYAPHSAVGKKYTGRHFPPAPRDLPKTKHNPKGQFPHGDCGTKGGKRIDCYSVRIENLPGNAGVNCNDRYDRVELPKANPAGGNTPCELQQYLRDRIRMVQAVNDMLRDIRQELTKRGLWKNTYLVFSADNGFHLGQGIKGKKGWGTGKGTARETDVRVPLIVEGAQSAKGRVRHEFAQNVDLGRTFLDMQPDVVNDGKLHRLPKQDGRSLLGLIRGEKTPEYWRNWAYFEHTSNAGAGKRVADPDAEESTMMQRTYQALRAGNELYVKYPHRNGASFSYGEVVRTANGRTNVQHSWNDLSRAKQDRIKKVFNLMSRCHGGWMVDGDAEPDRNTACQRILNRKAPADTKWKHR